MPLPLRWQSTIWCEAHVEIASMFVSTGDDLQVLKLWSIRHFLSVECLVPACTCQRQIVRYGDLAGWHLGILAGLSIFLLTCCLVKLSSCASARVPVCDFRLPLSGNTVGARVSLRRMSPNDLTHQLAS